MERTHRSRVGNDRALYERRVARGVDGVCATEAEAGGWSEQLNMDSNPKPYLSPYKADPIEPLLGSKLP